MNRLVVRLLLVSGLFVGWLGYLGFLVATRPVTATGWPLVVSRPQVMASRIDVVAEIRDPNGPIEVTEVLFPEQGSPVKVGDRLKVADLDECRPRPRRAAESTPPDFSKPGLYLVPLIARGASYEVAPIPPSPGFGGGTVRIYPATAEAMAQYRRIAKPAQP